MKVMLLSAEDFAGGAGKAAYRLHRGLLSKNIDSCLYAMHAKQSGDVSVVAPVTKLEQFRSLFRYLIDSTPAALYRNRERAIWSTNWLANKNVVKAEKSELPDILLPQMIGEGFINSYDFLKMKAPVAWSFHDMWAFTGGCHYCGECEGYKKGCGKCPQLKSGFKYDLSRYNYSVKKNAYEKIKERLTIIAPNRWMAECARQSGMFNGVGIHVIPYGIDVNVFRPFDKKEIRKILGLPPDKKIVLFSAMNPKDKRKGGHLLLDAFRELKVRDIDIELMVLSCQGLTDGDMHFKVNYMGKSHNELSLSLITAAADVVVVPSVQDNLPLVVIEALACGVPVVAFKVGGIPDVVKHKSNGYVADPFDPEDLADGMEFILTDDGRYSELSKNARKFAVDNLSMDIIIEKHLKLFENMIK